MQAFSVPSANSESDEFGDENDAAPVKKKQPSVSNPAFPDDSDDNIAGEGWYHSWSEGHGLESRSSTVLRCWLAPLRRTQSEPDLIQMLA